MLNILQYLFEVCKLTSRGAQLQPEVLNCTILMKDNDEFQ